MAVCCETHTGHINNLSEQNDNVIKAEVEYSFCCALKGFKAMCHYWAGVGFIAIYTHFATFC
jgi:hypothetical protein